ncbi:hypothetical protein TYRP_020908 [Tyrophagus putrescentiae]|nr:hypothetical protein TYRP_020908 [Tyrophagus putrescentiae]
MQTTDRSVFVIGITKHLMVTLNTFQQIRVYRCNPNGIFDSITKLSTKAKLGSHCDAQRN